MAKMFKNWFIWSVCLALFTVYLLEKTGNNDLRVGAKGVAISILVLFVSAILTRIFSSPDHD